MDMSKQLCGALFDARSNIMTCFGDIADAKEKIFFCENLKTLLCECELVARYQNKLD